jgi:hypothetical protein
LVPGHSFKSLGFGLLGCFSPAELQREELFERLRIPIGSVKHINPVLILLVMDLACRGVVCSSCNCCLCSKDSVSVNALADGGERLAAGGCRCIGSWG